MLPKIQLWWQNWGGSDFCISALVYNLITISAGYNNIFQVIKQFNNVSDNCSTSEACSREVRPICHPKMLITQKYACTYALCGFNDNLKITRLVKHFKIYFCSPHQYCTNLLSKGNGSLLCFARFMERDIARKNRNKCGWKMAMPFNYTSKDKS